jgi:hypothetical protein
MPETTQIEAGATEKASWSGSMALWLVVTAGIVLALLVNAFKHPLFLCPDCGALLYEGGLLLEGKVPYVDFIEINPPLIIYLNVLPAVLAKATGLSMPMAFQLFVIGLVVLSLAGAWCALKVHGGLDAFERGVALAVWATVSGLIYISCAHGQREHLFLLAFVPYLLLRLARMQGARIGPWHAGLTGLAAGVGCSLKPHFLLAVLFVEAILLLKGRSLKKLLAAENLWLAAAVALYAAHWLVVPRAMRQAYLGHWVPIAMQKYAVYGNNLPDLVNWFIQFDNQTGVFAFFGLGLLLCLGLRRWRELFPFIAAFAGLYYVGFAVYLLQGKGWHYHRIPSIAFLVLCLTFVFLQGRRLLSRDAKGPSAVRDVQWLAWAIGLAFIAMFLVFAAFNRPARYLGRFFDFVSRNSRPRDAILIVSTTANDAFPTIVQTDRRMASRYILAYPLVFAYFDGKQRHGPPYHAPAAMESLERQYLEDLGQDMLEYQPTLVILPSTPGGQDIAGDFQIDDYLTQVGWIDRWLGGYREIHGPTGFRCFQRVRGAHSTDTTFPSPHAFNGGVSSPIPGEAISPR